MMNNSVNYTAYHLHSDRSLLDSCTHFEDYIKKAKEYGMKYLAFTEHGNVFNWVEKKLACDEAGIKFILGCEVYLTEQLVPKIRDNYHTILIAKNKAGILELNTLIDKSTQEDHFYYKPRISFDEFLNISDNIIKVSACIMSPLSKLPKNNRYYEALCKKYDYYEIQYHNTQEQIEYNKHLYLLSVKYNKSLIAGGDFHNSNQYKAECRKILKKAKKMTYDDEDSYDLVFKSYKEFKEKFTTQNSLSEDVIITAIENTNIMADSCEEIILDISYKYPKLSDNDELLFKKRIYEKCKEKLSKGVIEKNSKYSENITEEIRVFKKLGMCSFMLFMSELCTWCRENKIPFGFCRGSVGGSTVAYILDIIDVNPVIWNTVFSRFANEDRIEIGDVDIDFSPSQRELVYQYIIDRFGYDKSAYILAIGTISSKGTIDEIARALDYSLDLAQKIKNAFDINEEKAREDYPELFYYFDGLINTAVSQSIHPAGIVASPVSLYDNYGCFWNDGRRIMQINMEEIHEVNLVKYDILGLKNIEIIKDTFELLNKEYPLSHEIDWNDVNVWNNIIMSPVGIFQFENSYAYELLKKFKPRKINDLSLVNAALRPSGASYRDRLIAREFNSNPSKQIDELLLENNGFLTFQEDTLKFLTNICGLSGSEADNVRRAIGRKQTDRLEKALPHILEGYCSNSDKPREIAEQEAKEFLKIIEDSSNYQFGYNHSTGYSMIGYLCAYLRYYYPLEFTTAYLNNANNEDDMLEGTKLANILDIKILSPKFGYSSGKYHPDKDKKRIYKGIGSIKFCNNSIGQELLELSKSKTYDDFIDLLIDITEQTTCSSRNIEILIKIGFFDRFGKNGYLLSIYEKFKARYKKTHKDKTKILRVQEVKEYAVTLENTSLPINKIVEAELEYVGYISYIDPTMVKSVVLISEIKSNKYGTVFAKLYRLSDGATVEVKMDKNFYADNKLKTLDVINIIEVVNKKKRKLVDGKWTISDETEAILNRYSKVLI